MRLKRNGQTNFQTSLGPWSRPQVPETWALFLFDSISSCLPLQTMSHPFSGPAGPSKLPIALWKEFLAPASRPIRQEVLQFLQPHLSLFSPSSHVQATWDSLFTDYSPFCLFLGLFIACFLCLGLSSCIFHASASSDFFRKTSSFPELDELLPRPPKAPSITQGDPHSSSW